jgi:glutamyl-tRNA reductase
MTIKGPSGIINEDMINGLTVINLKSGSNVRPTNGEVFTLKTCQRTLILGFGDMAYYHLEDKNDIRDVWSGDQAYIFYLKLFAV